MIKYLFTFSSGFVGARQEEEFTVQDLGYSENEWNLLNPVEQENVLSSNWEDWINNYIDGGWQKI